MIGAENFDVVWDRWLNVNVVHYASYLEWFVLLSREASQCTTLIVEKNVCDEQTVNSSVFTCISIYARMQIAKERQKNI